MSTELKLTPTERKLYEALADGLPHGAEELLPLIDACADMNSLRAHMCRLRKKIFLHSAEEDLISQMVNRRGQYRRVRHLNSAENVGT